MAKIVELGSWRESKVEQLKDYPALECPTCETECPPVTVNADNAVVYRCVGNGHRALTWRIDEGGAMLHGANGSQYYG